ncbi:MULTISPECIES: hypothetical protein, partial [unclassified Microcoleus]|uniref:hypothetical protein n=2 Tax=unclassified Microcoleus TaxID=2642155 RepID=UPI0025E875A5
MKRHPNSLRNLQPGANNKGKVRVALTLKPRTVALLKAQGNMSEAVDKLIELCIVGAVRHDGCLNPILPERDVTNSGSKDAHGSIEAKKLPEREDEVTGYYPPPLFWTRT